MKLPLPFDWDDVYEAGEDWGDIEPSDYVVDADRRLPRQSHVLDVGCGGGRNAIYLASQGHEVEAFDISAAAISGLQLRCSRQKLDKLTAYQANLIFWQSKQRFDFVILHGVLNSLPHEHLGRVMAYLRSRLKPGGLLFVSIFHPLPNEVALGGVNVMTDIDSSTVTTHGFYGCSVERHDFRIFSHSHRSLPEHTHCIERFLFCRQAP